MAFGGYLFLRDLNLDDYKDDIAAEVKDITSRDLDIRGHITFSISLKPTITVRDLTLSNASWASEPAMLAVDRLDITLDLIALIFGVLDSTELTITGGKLSLERSSDDQANWHLGLDQEDMKQTADYLEGPFPYVHAIRLADFDVGYRDRQSGTEFSGRLNSFEAAFESNSHRLHADLDARIREQSVAASGTVTNLLDLYNGGASAVDLSVKLGQTKLSFDGTADAKTGAPSLKGTLEGAAPGPADLATLAGVTLPDLGAITASGTISLTPTALQLKVVDTRIGSSDVQGEIEIGLGDQRSFTVDLSGHRVDLTPFVAERGREPAAPAAETANQGLLFPDQPLFFDELPSLVANVKLAVDALVIGELTLEDALLQVQENDRTLKVDPFRFVFKGATFTGRASVEAAKLPRVSLKVLTQNFDLGSFLAEQNVTDLVTGEIDIGIDVQGEGNSPHAIVASLDGTASFVMSKGRIASQYIDLIAADLFRMLMPWNDRPKEARVKCALAQFEIKKGRAKTRAFLFDTKQMAISGKGKIDLGSEELHFRLRPRPKDPALVSLATGLLLTGKLTDIKASVDPRSLLIGAAEAAVGVWLLGPAGILVPFASLGAGHHHPCINDLPKVFSTQVSASPSDSARPTSPSEGASAKAPAPQSLPVPTTIRIAFGGDNISSNVMKRHLTDLGFSNITKMDKQGAVFHVEADWQGQSLALRVDARRGTIEHSKP